MKYIERKPTRLKQYSYSNAGYYFITICAYKSRHIFGEVCDATVILNPVGKIVHRCLLQIPDIYDYCELDEHSIMPNHLHLILINNKTEDEESRSKMLLSTIMQQFKRACTVEIRNIKGNEFKVWQGSFFDRIIRNETELNKIREYIRLNPLRWEIDKNSPENIFM